MPGVSPTLWLLPLATFLHRHVSVTMLRKHLGDVINIRQQSWKQHLLQSMAYRTLRSLFHLLPNVLVGSYHLVPDVELSVPGEGCMQKSSRRKVVLSCRRSGRSVWSFPSPAPLTWSSGSAWMTSSWAAAQTAPGCPFICRFRVWSS